MSASSRAAALHLAREPLFVHADGRVGAIEQKDALMLAYLAIEGPTPRRTLAALLWPDVDAGRARANLRQRLFRLRRSVGRDLLEGGDVAALCANIEVVLDGAEGEANGLLQGLADTDAGGLAEWLDSTRERRRARHIRALADSASALEAAGQLAPALAAAQQLVEADPTSEHARRRLMRLHYLRGDRAAALAAFDRCCDVLETVLGVAPDAETEALRACIAAGTWQLDATQPRPLPVSVLRPPRIIGRAEEWQALHAAWGAGHASLIAGEAGLGKTRLVTDFARAHPDALVVDARPGDVRVPHALLSRLLRQLIDRLEQPLPPGVVDELAHLLPDLGRAEPMRSSADNMRFVNAVETLVRQACAQGVSGLVVDDLQFADAASVEVLQHLAAAGIGWRWIVAYRPAELASAARAFHDEFLGAGAARLHVLRPLDAAQIADLIDTLGVAELESARLAPALARHTGGNPLYLLETLKLMLAPAAAGADVPAGLTWNVAPHLPTAANVTRLIEQRIGRLSAGAVKLARCAAIAGLDFSPELAVHVLGVRALDLADTWAELDAAQVLRDGVFAHDLIFEAARDSVPAPIARQLHGEMAAFMETRAVEPAHVAQHWLDAGEALKALPWLIAAAGRAAAAWRPAEEGALLQRAAHITKTLGADRVAAFALLKRAHRAHLLSSLGSVAHVEVLDALVASAELPLERAYARFARADTLAQQGDGVRAEADARAGLGTLEGEPGPAADELVVDLTSALANALFIQDRPGAGADAVRAVEPRLLSLHDRQREMEHYANLGVLLDAGNRHPEAQAALNHVIALARAQGDRSTELVVLSNLASSLHDIGRVGAALEPLREAYRLKQAFPELRTSALFVQVQLGNMQRGLGAYAEALDWLTEGLAIVSQYVPQFAAAAHNGYARLWLDLGQFARVQQHLRQALEATPGPPLFRAMTHLLRARTALEQAQRGVAAEALAAADSFIIASTRYGVRAQAQLLASGLEDADVAYRSATAVALEAGRLQMHGVRMAALAVAARAALACGHEAVAATHTVEALALWPEHVPDDLYMGEVWLVAVDSLEAAGDPRAGAVLRTAAAWIAATAQGHVPAEFRDSFLNRNAANRSLMARAANRG